MTTDNIKNYLEKRKPVTKEYEYHIKLKANDLALNADQVIDNFISDSPYSNLFTPTLNIESNIFSPIIWCIRNCTCQPFRSIDECDFHIIFEQFQIDHNLREKDDIEAFIDAHKLVEFTNKAMKDLHSLKKILHDSEKSYLRALHEIGDFVGISEFTEKELKAMSAFDYSSNPDETSD